MPDLIKLLIRNAAIGFGVAIVFVACIMLFDIGSVGTLVYSSDTGFVALFMLTFFMGLTFGSAQMGFAVMLSGAEKDRPGGGGKRRGRQHLDFAPIRVRTPTRR